MSSYQDFVAYMKQKADGRTKRDCPHVSDRLVVNGVTLPCCGGSYGAQCKTQTIRSLLSHIKDLHRQNEELKAQAPQVINNTTINNTINIQQVYIGDVLTSQSTYLAKLALQGNMDNAYATAFHILQTLPVSEERNKMLQLATSKDHIDLIEYKKEIIGVMSVNAQLSEQEAEILHQKTTEEEKSLDKMASSQGCEVEKVD